MNLFDRFEHDRSGFEQAKNTIKEISRKLGIQNIGVVAPVLPTFLETGKLHIVFDKSAPFLSLDQEIELRDTIAKAFHLDKSKVTVVSCDNIQFNMNLFPHRAETFQERLDSCIPLDAVVPHLSLEDQLKNYYAQSIEASAAAPNQIAALGSDSSIADDRKDDITCEIKSRTPSDAVPSGKASLEDFPHAASLQTSNHSLFNKQPLIKESSILPKPPGSSISP